ncbi:transcriptional activator RinB [Staphylococcus hominis]
MVKKLVKLIILASISVLGIYLTRYMIVILESEDDIDAPADYALNGDQSDLNEVIP